jgi:hypothetical protein
MITRLLLALALITSACASHVPEESPGPEPLPAWDPAGTHGALSSDGSYWVVYRALPNDVPVNSEFAVEFYVTHTDVRDVLIAPETVTVDARMPGHGHGMLYDVSTARTQGGTYATPGMLFHMTGHWELYVDITLGPWTERAQFDIDLE